MSIGPRQRQGRELCGRLAEQIALIAVPGIGQWDGAWEIVADADIEFMVALLNWEHIGGDDALAPVRTAYDRAINAWREAARQYEEQGQKAS